tara:strand:+ start:59 stop:325 length:267 start_codon:yes stop_codon:yes gene_type:complete
MRYKVVKYKKKQNCPFETYTPDKRVKITRQNTVPWVIRLGNRFACLGGLIGFWASSGLMLIKGFFSAEEKIRKFSFNNKIIEIKIKKK